MFVAGSIAAVLFQLRPDYANPRAIRDARVRRALAHGVDKATLGETIWGGEVAMLDTIFDPALDYYATIDRAIARYPYDPRTSERLMSEAGFTKGSDGVYVPTSLGRPAERDASAADGRLVLDLKSSQGRSELPVLAAGWRELGFDMQESFVPRALSTDPEARSSFPTMYLNVFAAQEVQQMTVLLSSQAGGPENRWRGENRGGWQNPDYDRLVETFNITLDPRERIEQRARIAKLLSEELPHLVLSFNVNAHALRSTFKGLTQPSLYTTGALTWNIEHWELD